MGYYNKGWYGFEIESKKHLLDMIINPSFRPAVCFQYHEMANGSLMGFYNFQPPEKEMLEKLKEYVFDTYGTLDMPFSGELMDDAVKAGRLKPITPVSDFRLTDEEKLLVYSIYEGVNDGDLLKHSGLDGTSYELLVYQDGNVDLYEHLHPQPMSNLGMLITLMVDRLGLDQTHYYV